MQHDAEEFLRYILSAVEDAYAVVKKEIPAQPDPPIAVTATRTPPRQKTLLSYFRPSPESPARKRVATEHAVLNATHAPVIAASPQSEVSGPGFLTPPAAAQSTVDESPTPRRVAREITSWFSPKPKQPTQPAVKPSTAPAECNAQHLQVDSDLQRPHNVTNSVDGLRASIDATVNVVEHLFCGSLRSVVKCIECEGTSNTKERFMHLSLPVPRHGSLSAAMSQFFQSERYADRVELFLC